MGKLISMQEFLNKRFNSSVAEQIAAIDDQMEMLCATGWCDHCNAITSDLQEVNNKWVCSECFNNRPHKGDM